MSAESRPPMATPRIAAGVVVLSGESILMVRPTYKEYWDIPGGYVEPGESPKNACAREVQEEIGLSVDELLLAAVDWAPNDKEGDKLLFLFISPELNGIDAANLKFPDQELSEARYVSLAELHNFTIPRLAKRLAATVEALISSEVPIYLENGIRTETQQRRTT
ncbi:NUDIX domain-containing protein [Nocardia sp. A7]|uniref:NUDIX domain-containing protein n=1 Tax=Nocardia sp. A7 TaxID=2789274 RepID=UPI003978C066